MVDFSIPIETFHLFNEKAEDLANSRFVRDAEADGIKFTMNVSVGKVIEAKFEGPDAEAVKAMAVTYRQFMQNNDRISLGNIAKLYHSLPLSDALKSQFTQNRSTINKMLDEDMGQQILDERFTGREIIEGILYGDIAHTTKRDIFKRWDGDSIKAPFTQAAFRAYAHKFIYGINVVKNNNLDAISELEELTALSESSDGRGK